MQVASDSRKVAAELVATFLFVFVGAGGVISAAALGPSTGLLVAAFANGIGLALAVSISMNVSGGHVNPAVTLAMLVTKRIKPSLAIAYIVAQVLGATIAATLLVALVPASAGSPVHYGAPSLAQSTSVATGILLEFIMTFVLLVAVFGTAVDPRAPKMAGIGIGLAVFLDVLVGGPYTGAMMNPARALGPEIASGFFAVWYVYWIGPILGGITAALVYDYAILGSSKQT
jgi:MIP family channel proteins